MRERSIEQFDYCFCSVRFFRCGNSHIQLNTQALSKSEVARSADLQATSAHWLRRELVTALVNHADLKTGLDQAGHDNIATTDGYLHQMAQDRHAAVLALMEGRRGKHDDA